MCSCRRAKPQGDAPLKQSPKRCPVPRPLRSGCAPSKAGRVTLELSMTAILTILAFLVVIGGLNYFEFGRLD